MSKSLEKTTLEWVRDNCPRAAMLDPDKTLEVVQQVMKDTGTFRFVLNVAGSVGGVAVGLWLANYWSISETSRALYIGTVALGAFLAALLSTTVGQIYLHRKLESAFERT
ncbi:MAG: hypothetical protein QNI99_05100 [Woeseiaceae bacterium]|nr:hypothetical protein [Woeseiaceae bacterium]